TANTCRRFTSMVRGAVHPKRALTAPPRFTSGSDGLTGTATGYELTDGSTSAAERTRSYLRCMSENGLRSVVSLISIPDDLVAGIIDDTVCSEDRIRVLCSVTTDNQGVVDAELVHHLRVLDQLRVVDRCDSDRSVLNQCLSS